jgi:GAF domain-containing protein
MPLDMPDKHPLDALASTLADIGETDDAINKIVAIAVETVGTNFGGITLIHEHGARFETVGQTHPSVADADRLQYELREGPCVDAALESTSFASTNLATDPRWPTWGPAVSALGFHSILSSEIHGRGKRIGALNLYGAPDTDFTEDDFELAQGFAHQASVVLSFALHEDELLQAIDTHVVIGQAEGILMQRFKIGPRTASVLLRRYALNTGATLRGLAEYVVQTRDLPDDDPDQRSPAGVKIR